MGRLRFVLWKGHGHLARTGKESSVKASQLALIREIEPRIRDLSQGHKSEVRTLDRPERVDMLVEFLSPTIDGLLRRIEGEEFTTTEFIAVMQSDPAANAAYDEALRLWGEGERYAKMVVHGQVIPTVLRKSGLVEWLGFAHGEEDPYAVPARWRLLGG
jgi:hypothetical protein